MLDDPAGDTTNLRGDDELLFVRPVGESVLCSKPFIELASFDEDDIKLFEWDVFQFSLSIERD